MPVSLTEVAASALRQRIHFSRQAGSGIGALGLASIVVICILVAMAVFAPQVAPHDPTASNITMAYQGPSSQYLLGTDNNGHDLLSRLMFGARTSLIGPLMVIMLSTVLATILALIASWYGGAIDTLIARALDIIFAFPGILLAILTAAVFGAGLMPAVIALSISYIPYIGRIVRSAAIRERSLPYVEALFLEGVSGIAIGFWHLAKNLIPVIVAQATVSFGYALVDLASLSYLGLGVQRPTADWGLMVANGQQGLLLGYPEESLYAGALILLAVAAFNILGERLADTYGGGSA